MEGITRENICILTDYSPGLTFINQQIILQRYNDLQVARNHLINANENIEFLVIDLYGENNLDIPVNNIVNYISVRLRRESGIDIISDLARLTEGASELSSDAVYNIIDIHGAQRGRKLVERINKFLAFLYSNGFRQLFSVAQLFTNNDDDHAVKLIPYNATQNSSATEDTSCPICFDNNTVNLVSTPCNHIYHSKCIEEWLKSHNTCPLCRKQI